MIGVEYDREINITIDYNEMNHGEEWPERKKQ